MNWPRPRVTNGTLSVVRSLLWKLEPTLPVRYQRSSNSCALAACAKARPARRATLNMRLFMAESLCMDIKTGTEREIGPPDTTDTGRHPLVRPRDRSSHIV